MRQSHIWSDLRKVRNMRQALNRGLYLGGGLASAMDSPGAHFPEGNFSVKRDAEAALTIGPREYPAPDGKLTFDKLSSVFLSGNRSRDDQPNHVRIAPSRAARGGRGLGGDVPRPGVRDRR